MSTIQNQFYARPYAEAAYRFAKQQGQVAAWQDFLNSFASFFANEQIQQVITNPFVEQSKIVQTIREALQNQISAPQSNFLMLLAENNRLIYLTTIAKYFEQLHDEDAGTLRVKVQSAFALDEAACERLKQKLTSKFQKQIVMLTEVNPELIGGLQIQIGDHVLGASVKDMLAMLNQSLSHGSF